MSVLGVRIAGALLVAGVLGGSACRAGPASLEIVPAALELTVGQSAELHVVAIDEKGAKVQASLERPLGIDVTWSSAHPAHATVENAALERAWRPQAVLRGVAPGTTEIVAQCCNGKTARAQVTVR